MAFKLFKKNTEKVVKKSVRLHKAARSVKKGRKIEKVKTGLEFRMAALKRAGNFKRH